MKNKMGTMAFTGVLALTAAFSMTVFAEESKTVEPSTGGSSIVQDNLATADVINSEPLTEGSHTKEATPNFVTTTGKIESVTKDGENYSIAVTNDGIGMVFHVGSDVFVVNRKDNSNMNIADLKAGMEITGIVKALSPQTMSLPPQTPGAVGFVVNVGEGSTTVGHFDGEFTNAEAKLMLNIDEKTAIVDQKGTKKVFTAEDVKNQDLVVFYSKSTKSIPAQTSPDFIMILEEPVVADAETVESMKAAELIPSTTAEAAPTATPKAATSELREMVALRTTAESAGYTVKWTSNNEPVVLEKDGVSVSISVGQDSFSKNGETAIASDSPVLKDSQIFISADVADALK